VRDADADPDEGNGFTFGPAEVPAYLDAVRRAIAVHRQPDRWAAIQRRGMTTDFSWAVPAGGYEQLYRRAIELRQAAAAG
jgi:starch synthase